MIMFNDTNFKTLVYLRIESRQLLRPQLQTDFYFLLSYPDHGR